MTLSQQRRTNPGRRPARLRRVRRRFRRAVRRHMRRLVLAAAVIVCLVVLAGAWIAIRALQAKSDLLNARRELTALRADFTAGRPYRSDLDQFQRDAAAAQSKTHDPVWFLASWLPPVHTVRGLAAATDSAARTVLPPLARIAPTLTPARLRVSGDTIDLAPLERAAAPLASVDAAAARIATHVATLPNGWFGPVADARNQFALQTADLSGSLDAAARFARIGPAMLGAHGVRRYFVAVENNAESRGTGGLVGAYTIVAANHGRLRVVQHGTDADLLNAPRPVINLGPDYQAAFGAYGPTTRWATSNLTANFPEAARTWAALWAAQSHQHVDGAFGLDPVALSAILGATGPATVQGSGQVVTAGNVVDLTERRQYELFPSINPRKSFLDKVATAVIHRALSGSGSAANLATALARSAGTGHLALWSARPAEESVVAPTPLSGQVPPGNGPFAALVVNNDAGSKLDYYLDRSLDYEGGQCRSDGTRFTQAVIRLRNDAPRTGLPAYVRIRDDGPHRYVETVPTTRLLVSLYAARGAQLVSATLNGGPVDVSPYVDAGRPMFLTNLEIAPQATATLVITLLEPQSARPASTWVQPLVRPQHTLIAVSPC